MIPQYSFKAFKFIPCDTEFNIAPKARSGHRIVCDEGDLYSFGGYNPDERTLLFIELWKFNFATSKWTMLKCEGRLPNEVASNAVLLARGMMMIYGGTGFPFGQRMSNKLYVCDLRVMPRPTMKLLSAGHQSGAPMKLYGQAMVLIGQYLYVVGGTTGYDYSSDVHRFDFQTKLWEPIYLCTGNEDVEPNGRYRHELACDGTRIFVLGGGTAEAVFGLSEISAFNTAVGKWEKFSSRCDPLAPPPGFPKARKSHACVQMRNGESSECKVFISGGHDGTQSLDDVWRLEIPSLQWTHLPDSRMPLPVYFHSAAVTPSGCMYTFGGIVRCENGSEQRTAEVDAIWLCVPKLSSMCWEAIKHYNPKLDQFTDEKLYECGIPFSCIEQLK